MISEQSELKANADWITEVTEQVKKTDGTFRNLVQSHPELSVLLAVTSGFALSVILNKRTFNFKPVSPLAEGGLS